jgi:hypothetical protein
LAAAAPAKQRKPKIDTIDNPFAVREEEIAQAPAPSGIAGLGDVNHLALLSTPYAQQNDYEMPEDAVGGFAGGGLAAFAGGGVPGYNGDPKTGSVVADPISEQLRGSELYNTRAKFDALQKKLAVEEAKAAQGDKAAARDALEIRQEMERVWRALGTPNTVKAGDLVGQGFRKDQMLPPPSRGYGQNIAERAQEHSNADLAKNIVDVEKRLATETDPSKRAYLETRKKALLAEQKAAAPAPALAPAPAPALATSNPPTSGPNYVAPTVPAFAPPANTGNRPSPPPANTAYQPPAAQLPPIDRPNVGKKSFADYVKETTPTIEALPKPDVEELPALATKRKDAYAAEGYDPDMYNKRIAALEEKREAAGGGRERAIGEAIMTAGLKLMGARRGQEFQALSEGAQEGLKSYQAAVKDIKSLQEKYDERMDAYRMADMQARKTGVDTDMARRDSQLAAVKAVEAKLFEARNDATKVGIQTAAQMTNADKQLFASTYSTNVGAQTAREYTGALKEQQIEASKAKILVDAAGDYITKNASNPKYMQNPEQLQTDAVAYANSIGAQLGIIPKGANFAPPPSPDANYYKENFGVTPTR